MRKIIAILDNIRSALNVGAIMRTCEGAGVEALYTVGITPSTNHPKVIKTALGAEQSIFTSHFEKVEEAIQKAYKQGYSIIAIEKTNNSSNIFTANLPNKVAFIFGHEITGVSPVALKLCDSVLDLPMEGIKESLNVATTAGIVIYNAKFGK